MARGLPHDCFGNRLDLNRLKGYKVPLGLYAGIARGRALHARNRRTIRNDSGGNGEGAVKLCVLCLDSKYPLICLLNEFAGFHNANENGNGAGSFDYGSINWREQAFPSYMQFKDRSNFCLDWELMLQVAQCLLSAFNYFLHRSFGAIRVLVQ